MPHLLSVMFDQNVAESFTSLRNAIARTRSR